MHLGSSRYVGIVCSWRRCADLFSQIAPGLFRQSDEASHKLTPEQMVGFEPLREVLC
jgi:hypothetical protein